MKAIIFTLLLCTTVLASPCYERLVDVAGKYNFTVTATTNGRHNHGSKHYLGMAVDVRTRDKNEDEISSFMTILKELGYVVRDERVCPIGQRVWHGPHLHLEVMDCLAKPRTELIPGFDSLIKN